MAITITDLATAIARQEGNNFGNNPGNLMYAGQYGATKNANGFAVFSSPELGWLALERQIALDAKAGNTLSSFLNKYAPPSENNTATYIANVSSWTGIQPGDKLSDVLGKDAVTSFFAPTPAVGGNSPSTTGLVDWSGWFGADSGGEVVFSADGMLGIPWWAWLAAGVVGLVVAMQD